MRLMCEPLPAMTLSSNLTTAVQYLPPKVVELSKDLTKHFPHTKRVGNYLLGRTLGEGSFAKVKEGLHTLTGEKVAVKVIDKKKAKEDAYVRKNLRREGKLLQMVRHPNIIKLYEVMETENSYYLVTELCEGGDLMDHICSKKHLDEKETRKCMRQVISAMDYLHKAGILHRDLKVENLLLDGNKDIKIIDFGLSNAVKVSSKDGATTFQEFFVTQCGSPAYAAPELLGNKKYGPKVDIWSAGVNMYAMLTGNLPFTVEPFNIKALHAKMLNGEMNPVPENLSKGCKDLLKKLLTPDPERRISLQDAMQHPWITENKSRLLEPAPFPNRPRSDEMEQNILKHMAENMDYKIGEVIRFVIGNVPNSATATYHLFKKKLLRHFADMKIKNKVALSEARVMLGNKGKAAGGTATTMEEKTIKVTPAEVIDLLPVGVADDSTKAHPYKKGQAALPHFDNTDTKVAELNHLSRQKTEVNPDRKVIRRQVNNIQGAPPRTGDNNSRASEEHPPVSHTLNPGITTDAFRRRNSTKEVQKSGPAGEKGALFKLPTDGLQKRLSNHGTNGAKYGSPAKRAALLPKATPGGEKKYDMKYANDANADEEAKEGGMEDSKGQGSTGSIGGQTKSNNTPVSSLDNSASEINGSRPLAAHLKRKSSRPIVTRYSSPASLQLGQKMATEMFSHIRKDSFRNGSLHQAAQENIKRNNSLKELISNGKKFVDASGYDRFARNSSTRTLPLVSKERKSFSARKMIDLTYSAPKSRTMPKFSPRTGTKASALKQRTSESGSNKGGIDSQHPVHVHTQHLTPLSRTTTDPPHLLNSPMNHTGHEITRTAPEDHKKSTANSEWRSSKSSKSTLHSDGTCSTKDSKIALPSISPPLLHKRES